MIKKSTIFAIFAAAIAVFFYYYNENSTISNKPLVRYKFINGWPGIKLEHLSIVNDALRENFTVKEVSNDYDIIIDNFFSNEKIDNPNSIKIFYTGEAFTPKIDGYDISMGFDNIDHPNYLRVPLYFMQYGPQISLNYTRGKCAPKKKFFACFLVSQKGGPGLDGCTARNSIFHKLSAYKRVESGGSHLKNTGKRIRKKKTMQWLSQCKFVIAYENQSYEGYITEKPFQAYFAGAIPIYYSHRSTMQDLNPKAVIYAPDFPTEESLVEYIKKVDNDDKLYCDIWEQKIITNYDQSYAALREKFKTKFSKVLNLK